MDRKGIGYIKTQIDWYYKKGLVHISLSTNAEHALNRTNISIFLNDKMLLIPTCPPNTERTLLVKMIRSMFKLRMAKFCGMQKQSVVPFLSTQHVNGTTIQMNTGTKKQVKQLLKH